MNTSTRCWAVGPARSDVGQKAKIKSAAEGQVNFIRLIA
jgi:hypothetical protein